MKIHLSSPAKVNLTLKVLGKRSDGYHNLSTVFEKIDLCDELCFSPNKIGRVRIICSHPAVPKGKKNLVVKAAQMLRSDFDIDEGVDIKIAKKIPVAAGLAGGSSNGATALLGLNKLWKLNLTQDKLLVYAKRLGSDVPLFIYKYIFAHGRGRGEVLKDLKIGKKWWHVLVLPSVKVYTKEVFSTFKMGLTKGSDNANILTCALRKNDFAKVTESLSNDLEAALVHAHPQLLKIKNNIKLISGLNACFSGSGPSIFALAKTRAAAQKAARVLKRRYKNVVVARTL